MVSPRQSPSQPPHSGGCFVLRHCGLFLLLFLCLPLTLSAQPRLILPQGPSFNYGAVLAGERPVHIIPVGNEGTDTLRIQSATAQCNCSQIRILSGKIPPGGTGYVEVTFLSDFDKGRVSKGISLITNDPHQPVTYVRFSVEVERLVEFEPHSVIFTAAEAVAMTPKVLAIRNLDSLDLTVLSVVDTTGLVQPRTTGMLIPAGGTGLVELQARPIGSQSRHGVLIVRTTSLRQPVFRLRYSIEGLTPKE